MPEQRRGGKKYFYFIFIIFGILFLFLIYLEDHAKLSPIEYICGNGLMEGEEQCDDGNINNFDGCNSLCSVEEGFVCINEASECYSYIDERDVLKSLDDYLEGEMEIESFSSLLSFYLESDFDSRIVFVDGSLMEDCASYNKESRTCGTGGYYAYKSFDNLQFLPGLIVKVREGEYKHAGNLRSFVKVNISGTGLLPIVLENYKNEKVKLVGKGFEDKDLNGDGLADGSAFTNEILIEVLGENSIIRGFEVVNSTRWGVYVKANRVLVEDIITHDNWETGIAVFNASFARIKNIEAYNNRHQSGVWLSVGDFNLVENVISYNNGREPSGDLVLPIGGDPAGGGNSDAIAFSKDCEFNGKHLCRFNIVKNVVGFGNADDGIDVSFSDSVIENSIMFNNGPHGGMGYKILRDSTKNNTYRGVIAFNNTQRGFDLRSNISDEGLKVFHAAAFLNKGRGINGLAGNSEMKNSMGYLNGGGNIYDGLCGDCSNNWDGNYGDPFLINEYVAINISFNENMDVSEKIVFISEQFKNAFSPKDNSPLIDSGDFVEGYHCETAGEQNGNCREWSGNAPDIGVFETSRH